MTEKEFGMGRVLLRLVICLVISFAGLHKVSATAFQLFTQVTEYQSDLIGDWEVVSKVIWSDSPYVKKGTKSVSTLKITEINGSLYPKWEAGPWKTVRNKVLNFTPKKSLEWEIETKFEEDINHYWFVRTVNKFDFSQDGQFKGKSYHKEYLNGEEVGSYITVSYLQRK